MTDKLLPCPFCGSEPAPYWNGVGCANHGCIISGMHLDFDKWNTRAAPRQPEGEGLEVVAWRHCADRTKLLCDLGKQRAIPGDYADEFTIPLCSMPDAQRAIAELRQQVEDLELHLASTEDDLENARRNASAFENRMGELQVENGKLQAERDTLHQQLAERDAEIERLLTTLSETVGNGGVILRQRDKLAGLLDRVITEVGRTITSELRDDIDAALAEVKP